MRIEKLLIYAFIFSLLIYIGFPDFDMFKISSISIILGFFAGILNDILDKINKL